MLIDQSEFIGTLGSTKLPRGELAGEPLLTKSEFEEFRSIFGSLQWLCGQSRPEVASTVSLSNKGAKTTVQDLKALYGTVAFLSETNGKGIVMNDIPINTGSVIVSYADSSWANCEDCRSQFGTLALLTTSKAQQTTTEASLLDWRSGTSSRVCRSTLAAEASAADESVDRASFLNMYI